MRTFKFNEFEGDNHFETTITEDEILETYFDYWAQNMVKAGKSKAISKEHCIEDFIVVHWAWEIDNI